MWMFSLSALVAFATTASAFTILPPKNGWAKIGSTQELICKADGTNKPIKTCSWDTPYGKNYPLEDGLKAESGRLEYTFERNAEMECGIKITKVEAMDDGEWECNIGIVDETGEIKTSKGKSSLSIAQKPQKPALMEPFDGDFINVTSEAVQVQCLVENAMPAPIFVWKIDDEVMENAVTSDDLQNDFNTTWIQTLTYQPMPEHHNRTLACQVSHPGFEEGDVTRADTIVDFSGAGGMGIDLFAGNDEPSIEGDSKRLNTFVTVIIVALVLTLICTVPCFGHYYWRKRRGDFDRFNDDSDEKKVKAEETGDAKEGGGDADAKEGGGDADASVKKNEVDPEAKNAETANKDDANDKEAGGDDKDAKEEAAQEQIAATATPSIGQKIVAFFRFKSEPLAEDKKAEDVEAAGDDEEKKVEQEEAKETDVKEKVEEEEEENTDKKANSSSSRLSSVWKLIKWPGPRNATAKKPEVGMEEGKSGNDCDTAKEKAAIEEEGEKKMVELEPEDKPEVPENEEGKKAEGEENEHDQKPEADRQQPAAPATPKEEKQLPSSPKNTPV